jgi:hypothetical protein
MGEVYTVWHALETRRTAVATRRRASIVLAIGFLFAMAASEVVFLRYVAGPDSISLISAAEGIAD